MESITLEIPPKVVSQMKLPPARAKRMLMCELVLRLYQERIITSGQGAYLLNMNRLAFEQFLADNAISIHCDPEELAQDIAAIENAL